MNNKGFGYSVVIGSGLIVGGCGGSYKKGRMILMRNIWRDNNL